MAITMDAIYEQGVLRPTESLPLQESERVTITVHTKSRVRQTAGLMGWTGSAELAERFAMDVELDPQEEP